MERILRIFIVPMFIMVCHGATCATATRTKPAMYVDPNAYSYMYPYLNNKMRTALNPGTTVSQTNNPIDIVVKTEKMSEPRRVVPRTRKSGNARAATNTTAVATPTSTRRVVQRNTGSTARAATATGGTGRTVRARSTNTSTVRATNTTKVSNTDAPSYSRCLADYTKCMDGYCARERTAYNRCYCSAKLAQIDAQYQENINDLITQIIQIRAGTSIWTTEEMNAYWMDKIGKYTGTNSWENLDNALNIEWPTADERIRGQNVFITGHSYCVQHLRACAPMASNMRDAYRSRISRDCKTYENTMIKIKDAAEAFIENYSE